LGNGNRSHIYGIDAIALIRKKQAIAPATAGDVQSTACTGNYTGIH
jgi:hypothetical protein